MNRLSMIIATAIATLASPLALADDDRAAMLEQRMEEAKARLELSDEQVDQVAPVLERSAAAQQDILSRYGVDLDSSGAPASGLGFRQLRAMRSELDSVRAGTLEDLQSILTAEQLGEYKRIQEERQAAMRDRIRGQR